MKEIISPRLYREESENEIWYRVLREDNFSLQADVYAKHINGHYVLFF